MTTSNRKKTALYCRLSQDDNTENESNSIQNQENICQGGFHHKDEIPLE
jgi:site-specific DNA recombinase